MSLPTVVQSSEPGDLVTLFRLDATSVGGSIYYFAQAAEQNEGVRFQGVYFNPVDVEFTDFEMSARGSPPQPKMRVANSNMVFQNLVNSLGDLLGCGITRIRTFSRFLDGKPEADPMAFFGPDMFKIERKANENPVFIEWELSTSIDQEAKLLPGRQVIRDTCTHSYRAWIKDEQRFDYSKASCPYAGSSSFDQVGQPTTSENDRCARRLGDCYLRFGRSAPLPFGGFPGAARVR